MLLKRRKQKSPKYHNPNIGREENLVYIHASTTCSMHLIQLREIENTMYGNYHPVFLLRFCDKDYEIYNFLINEKTKL